MLDKNPAKQLESRKLEIQVWAFKIRSSYGSVKWAFLWFLLLSLCHCPWLVPSPPCIIYYFNSIKTWFPSRKAPRRKKKLLMNTYLSLTAVAMAMKACWTLLPSFALISIKGAPISSANAWKLNG